MNGRRYSLAHLTMMELAPVDLVLAAAAAGFDSVGLRLVPTSDGVDHELHTSAARRAELRRVLDGTGVRLLDVEVLRLRSDGFGDVGPFFDAAAELGASLVLCTVEDDDRVRRVDTFAHFCAVAAGYGVRPALEYMVFSAVHTLAEALELIAAADPSAAVLVDTLHHERGGGQPEDVRGLTLGQAPYLQLCDSPVRGRLADARTEAVYARTLPGEGVLPLAELVAAMDEATTIAVEVPRPGQRRPDDPAAVAAQALAAARRVVRRCGGTDRRP